MTNKPKAEVAREKLIRPKATAGGGAVRDPSFVVIEEPTGRWVAGCCDDWHLGFWSADYATREEAERGRRAHRAADSRAKVAAAEEQARRDRAREAGRCPNCHYLIP